MSSSLNSVSPASRTRTVLFCYFAIAAEDAWRCSIQRACGAMPSRSCPGHFLSSLCAIKQPSSFVGSDEFSFIEHVSFYGREEFILAQARVRSELGI